MASENDAAEEEEMDEEEEEEEEQKENMAEEVDGEKAEEADVNLSTDAEIGTISRRPSRRLSPRSRPVNRTLRSRFDCALTKEFQGQKRCPFASDHTMALWDKTRSF